MHSRRGEKVMGSLRLEVGDDCVGTGGAGDMAMA